MNAKLRCLLQDINDVTSNDLKTMSRDDKQEMFEAVGTLYTALLNQMAWERFGIVPNVQPGIPPCGDDSRDEFERQCRETKPVPWEIDKDGNGEYVHPSVRFMWYGWKARASQPPEELPEIAREALDLFYRRYIHTDNCTYVAGGDCDCRPGKLHKKLREIRDSSPTKSGSAT